MPRTDDSSDGARQHYADQGSPARQHARTYDARRKEVIRPGVHQREDEFAEDLRPAQEPGQHPHSHLQDSVLAVDEDKSLRQGVAGLDDDQVRGLTVLTVGTRLEQGGVYLDLNRPQQGSFKALGNQEAGPDNRYVAKRDTDYETWDRLVGRPTV